MSAQERREPDAAHVSRIPGVQRLDDAVAARPCAGMGSGTPDDHRRVLSRDVPRDLGQNDRLGSRTSPARAESARNQGPFGATLTLQNYSSRLASPGPPE